MPVASDKMERSVRYAQAGARQRGPEYPAVRRFAGLDQATVGM